MNCVECESVAVQQYEEWSCRRKRKYAVWMWPHYCFTEVCTNSAEVKNVYESASGAVSSVIGPWALSLLPFAETVFTI